MMTLTVMMMEGRCWRKGNGHEARMDIHILLLSEERESVRTRIGCFGFRWVKRAGNTGLRNHR